MDLSGFLSEWNSPSEMLQVHTSGSTAPPKQMMVEKSRMLSSARMTCDFLGLGKGDSALLCMSLDYIAGKMMVVRTLERGLRLVSVTPCNHPLKEVLDTGRAEQFDLVAMVPSQVYCSMQVPEERQLLMSARNLIIGGGAIDSELEKELEGWTSAVWSTYGMTETLSHIAMRRISGKDRSEWYTPLEGVHVSLSADRCLRIDAPAVHEGMLQTNDLAVISGERFKIVGRKDNVICSGGIKLQMEVIEEKLRGHIAVQFCISKREDRKFGEVAVLLHEGVLDDTRELFRQLDRYERPKHIVGVEKIPLTETSKIDRKKCLELAKG